MGIGSNPPEPIPPLSEGDAICAHGLSDRTPSGSFSNYQESSVHLVSQRQNYSSRQNMQETYAGLMSERQNHSSRLSDQQNSVELMSAQQNSTEFISERQYHARLANYQNASASLASERQNYVRVENDTTDYDRSLAKQVFFFAQNCFLRLCKHVNFASNMDQLVSLQHAENSQKRTLNWVFRVGKMRYKKPHLQGANPELVARLVAMAQYGTFPESSPNTGNCPPFPLSSRGKFCPRPVHLQESPTPVHLKCDVEYHYFLMRKSGTEGYLSWAVVVGFGTHKHTWPIMKPSPKIVHRFVSSLCEESKILTGPMILQKFEERFGCAPSPATVKSIRRAIRKKSHPSGKSMTALLEAFRSQKHIKRSGLSYVLSVDDYRQSDNFDLTGNQRGLFVIFGDPRLLDVAALYPLFGCDGTFGIVKGYDEEGNVLSFELVSIVAKDENTGSLRFHEFIKQLQFSALQDPLRAAGKTRLTMATDFGRTYVFSLASILREKVMPGLVIYYMKAIAVGCDVHAKSCILEKCNIGNDRILFQWAIETQDLC
ncbi:hypothetical protein FGB62_336g022 [Gracilaria domingensis]|nr:hypothetical protein FGB62_336g022 [Gracilaria domingensis]